MDTVSLFAYFVISIPWLVFHNTLQGGKSTPQFFLSVVDKLKCEIEEYTDKSTSETFIELSRFRCSYIASTEWFLSCMAFRVYQVVHVAWQSRSWFVSQTIMRSCDFVTCNANDFLKAKSHTEEISARRRRYTVNSLVSNHPWCTKKKTKRNLQSSSMLLLDLLAKRWPNLKWRFVNYQNSSQSNNVLTSILSIKRIRILFWPTIK